MSRRRLALLAVAVIAIGLVCYWLLVARSGPPVVRVQYFRNTRSFAVLNARDEKLIPAHEMVLELRDDSQDGEAPDILAGCLPAVAADRFEKEPGQWYWFAAGLERAGDDTPLSAVYATRPFPKDFGEWTDRLARAETALFVGSEAWSGEAKHYWPDQASAEYTSAGALPQRPAAVIGDPQELAECARNPQFQRVADNVRSRVAGGAPVLDSVHLVRRSFAMRHPDLVARIEGVLGESAAALRADPRRAEALVKEYLRKNPGPGEKVPIPALIPQTEARDAARRWQQQSRRAGSDTMADLGWESPAVNAPPGIAPPGNAPPRGDEVPPFTDPRPRDVWADPHK